MPGPHVTPTQEADTAALRAAGFTVAAIVERTGLSASTIKRVLSRHGTKKGAAKKALVSSAQDELMKSLTDVYTRREVARAILDDLAISQQIRSRLLDGLEHLDAHKPKGIKETGMAIRALAAAATVLKTTSDTTRLTLIQREAHGSVADELPVLTVTVLSGGEISAIQASKNAEGLGISMDATEPADEECVIVEVG